MKKTLRVLLSFGLALAPMRASNASLFTLSPSSVSFSSSDPDLSVTSPTVTMASWTVAGGNKNQTWSLQVQANAASLTNCSKVQVAAIKVSCLAASVGSCNQAFTLSTTPQTIASGAELNGNSSYQVQSQVGFTDSWSYSAATSPSCNVTLTYTLQVG